MCKTATCWGDVITQVTAECASTPSFTSKERSTPQGSVHSKNSCIKKYIPYQQPCEGLNSLFLMENKKDRRVLKWEGMYNKEWMSPVSTCLYSCACSLNVPVYLEPSSPILKHYPPPSTHFAFHVIYWGSEAPVCGLQGLSAAQSGPQKTE